MKVFCAYAYTGEDANETASRMTKVYDLLANLGFEPYVDIFDPDTKALSNPADFIRLTINKLKAYDTLFVVATSERRSEGMLMELGAAIAARKHIIYAQHQSAVGKTYIPNVADQTFVWQTDEELLQNTGAMFGPLK